MTGDELVDVRRVDLAHRARPASRRGPAGDAPELAHRRDGIGVRAEVVELRHEDGAVLVHGVHDRAQRGNEALVEKR